MVRAARASSMAAVLAVASLALIACNPSATSTIAVTGSGAQFGVLTITATLSGSNGAAPAGVVVFKEAQTEIGRAELAPSPATTGRSVATLRVPAPTYGARTITSAYAGSTVHAGSDGTATLTVARTRRANLMTGSISYGGVPAAIGAGSYFSLSTAGVEPLAGQFRGQPNFETQTIARTVAGIGPVTLVVRPRWSDPSAGLTVGGRTLADGSITAGPSFPLNFRVDVLSVKTGGLTWSTGASCSVTGRRPALTGQALASSFTLSGGATVDPVGAACGSRGSLIDTVIGGRVDYAINSGGALIRSLPLNSASTTVAQTDGATLYPGDEALLKVSVTGPGGSKPRVNNSDSTIFADGEVVPWPNSRYENGRYRVRLDSVGPHTLRYEYPGFGDILTPSADEVGVGVIAAPSGLAATGTIRSLTNFVGPDPLPTGARLAAGAFNPATGALGPSTVWLPTFTSTKLSSIGPLTLRIRQVQPVTALIREDGTVSVAPASFDLEVTTATLGAISTWWVDGCTYRLDLTFSGTADAAGLHLSATDESIAPVGLGGPCLGATTSQQGLDQALSKLALTFHVPGDFTRT